MVIIAVSVAAVGAVPGWVAGLWLLLAYVAWRMDKRRREERLPADLEHEAEEMGARMIPHSRHHRGE
jgi:MYXO-CTERM domain-containing protein